MAKVITYLCDKCGGVIGCEASIRKVSFYIQTDATCGSYYSTDKILCDKYAKKLINEYEDFWDTEEEANG